MYLYILFPPLRRYIEIDFFLSSSDFTHIHTHYLFFMKIQNLSFWNNNKIVTIVHKVSECLRGTYKALGHIIVIYT